MEGKHYSRDTSLLFHVSHMRWQEGAWEVPNYWDKYLTLSSRDVDGHELMEVKDRVTGLHQHKSRLVPHLLSEIWSDKQIQMWRGEERGVERARERERKQYTWIFIPPSVSRSSWPVQCWSESAEGRMLIVKKLSYANSRLKPLQLVEVQEVYCGLQFFLIFLSVRY